MGRCAHHNELGIAADHDSFNDTVRRPLIPNPNSSRPKQTHIFSTITPPYYNFIHTTNLLPLNHHLGNATEQSRTHEYVEQPLGSSRWNPTPEQLLALEEMYRRGTRTPSAEQIQHIATQLRMFGKIEGKNVFYWFQNHKARERQKRRREIENNSEEKHHETVYVQEKKDSGLRKTSYDVEETKNWASSSNWSKYSEEFVPMHRSVAMADNGPHGWTQFDERELQQRKSTNNTVENMTATWQSMEFPCPHHLTNNLIMSTKATSLPPKLLNTITTNHRDHDQNLITSTSSSLTIKPSQENFNNVVQYESINVVADHQTLELFPLHSSDEHDRNSSSAEDDDATKKDLIEVVVPITTINTNNFTPSQYIEFLPLKN